MDEQQSEGGRILDEYLLNEIKAAKSLERLECLQNVIKDDTHAKHEYTQNQPYMDELRESWVQRRNQLTKRKST